MRSSILRQQWECRIEVIWDNTTEFGICSSPSTYFYLFQKSTQLTIQIQLVKRANKASRALALKQDVKRILRVGHPSRHLPLEHPPQTVCPWKFPLPCSRIFPPGTRRLCLCCQIVVNTNILQQIRFIFRSLYSCYICCSVCYSRPTYTDFLTSTYSAVKISCH